MKCLKAQLAGQQGPAASLLSGSGCDLASPHVVLLYMCALQCGLPVRVVRSPPEMCCSSGDVHLWHLVMPHLCILDTVCFSITLDSTCVAVILIPPWKGCRHHTMLANVIWNSLKA